MGADGAPSAFPCGVCSEELPSEAYNAKRLNGVRRGWVQLADLACKRCNAARAEALMGPVRIGGPLSRAKEQLKAAHKGRRKDKAKK